MSRCMGERNPTRRKWNQGVCQSSYSWGSRESIKASGLKINVQHTSLKGTKGKNWKERKEGRKKSFSLLHTVVKKEKKKKKNQIKVLWDGSIIFCCVIACLAESCYRGLSILLSHQVEITGFPLRPTEGLLLSLQLSWSCAHTHADELRLSGVVLAY